MKICLACSRRFVAIDWCCPACGYTPGTRDGFITFAPELEEGQDGFHADYFPRLAGLEDHHFWFRARNQLLIWATSTYFPCAGSLLEIGCGTGFVLAGIHQACPGMRLSGSDIFTQGLEFATRRLPGVDLFQMDARRIPFVGPFDLAGAFDVLEHIEDDQLVLHRMFQAVRPGGGILITVPQHPWLWSRIDTYSFHKRRYTREELVTIVQRAGFKIVCITSFVCLLLPVMVMARLRDQWSTTTWDPWSDLKVGRRVNSFAEHMMNIERSLIRGGRSLPVGGSLLLVATRPES